MQVVLRFWPFWCTQWNCAICMLSQVFVTQEQMGFWNWIKTNSTSTGLLTCYISSIHSFPTIKKQKNKKKQKKKNPFFSSERKDSRVPCYYVQFFYNLIKYSLKSFDAFFVWWGNNGKKSWKIYITKDFFFFFEGKGE